MSETLGLKNINMMSKDMYANIADEDIKRDELYSISGSGFGFPSDRYDDLELGASGTEYIAPANGWYWINKSTNGSNQYVTFGNDKGYSSNAYCPSSGNTIRMIFPAQKGDTVTVSYTAGGATNYFRFIYAEGE